MNISSPVEQKDDLFEVVLDTVSDGVTVIDNDLKIKFQNKVITQLFGSSMIGKHCYKAYRGRKEPIGLSYAIPNSNGRKPGYKMWYERKSEL
jgi:nitrogen fixation/metabolism regulation signal transduction histidine kinase